MCQLLPLADVVAATGGSNPQSAHPPIPGLVSECYYEFSQGEEQTAFLEVDLLTTAEFTILRDALADSSDVEVREVTGVGDGAWAAVGAPGGLDLYVLKSGLTTIHVIWADKWEDLDAAINVARALFSKLP
jgi:hypothetical protein